MSKKSKKSPKTAILDGDILCYRAAFWAESEGVEYLEERIQHDVKAWTPQGVTKIYIAMSCPRTKNFRRTVWPDYKAHRDVNKQTPEHLSYAEEIIGRYSLIIGDCYEADDIMGMRCSTNRAIAVTIDKDLRGVPGWHWNPDKEPEPVYVDSNTANFNFHIQWLTGDSTDNIPGIWKCGPAKAAKILEGVPPDQWTAKVLEAYSLAKDKDGNPYPEGYALAMARCVRILRHKELDKKKQPILWLPKVGATD